MVVNVARAGTLQHGLQVDVKRDGRLYTFHASFDTSLSKSAAYH